MSSTLEYMAKMHATLANNYRTPDGEYSESCGLIAAEIAKRLLVENRKPVILKIQGEPVKENGWLGNRTLVPQMYDGVAWGAHQFCCCDGIVYDPILRKPINIRNYASLVFGKGNFLVSVLAPPEEIREFIER